MHRVYPMPETLDEYHAFEPPNSVQGMMVGTSADYPCRMNGSTSNDIEKHVGMMLSFQ